MTNLPAILTAATALVAVFLGPFLAYRYAMRQVLATMREKWVSGLRDELTQLVGQADEMLPAFVQHRGLNKEFNEQYRKLVDREVKIRLMLTAHDDTDHKHLAACAAAIVALVGDERVEHDEKRKRFADLKTELIVAGQLVLKAAWEQVANSK